MTAGVHVLDMPTAVEAAWRAVFFVAAFCALGWVFVFLQVERNATRKLAMLALGVALAQPVVVNIERWGDPVFLEGLPVDTVVLAVALVALGRWTRRDQGRVERRRERVGD